MPAPMSLDSITDINLLSRFLACSELQDLSSCHPVDYIVICVSAVFHQAEVLFRVLEENPNLTKTLVLCGGKGHSTPLIYDAVAEDATYHPLHDEITGLPEARVLEKIMQRYFNIPAITAEGCRILIEDQSTNCSANAIECRKILEACGATAPKRMILIQDPTMQTRTLAAFSKVYSDLSRPPEILSCPIFIPKMGLSPSGSLLYDVQDVAEEELWEHSRFFGLIMGEIPRLRMYGPEGTNSIVHVAIPEEVEQAWRRLQDVLESKR